MLNKQTEKIGVLCGGFGGEREVSLRSGANVAKQLIDAGFKVEKIDVNENLLEVLRTSGISRAYNVLHGSFGEDGHIQAILSHLKIPYTNENLLNSALCFNKLRTKDSLVAQSFKTPEYYNLARYQDESEKGLLDSLKLSGLTLPCVLKLTESGSSIGVSLIKDETTLVQKLKIIIEKKEHSKWFIEEYIKGKEITVGVIRIGGKIVVLPILGLNAKNEFYDFEAKYTKGMTEMEMPAKLPRRIEVDVIDTASTIYKLFNFRGCIRIDMIIKNEIPYILEINTQPGMTDTSDVPAMVAASGFSMHEFLIANLENAGT